MAPWLRYVLLSPQLQDQIARKTGGTTRDSLNIGDLRKVVARIPPLPEQRRIVAKLDSLRARSSRARQELDRIPALIERYKQAILAKAFSGELTADWRARNRSSAGDFLLDDEIECTTQLSDMPALPHGWRWVRAGDLMEIKSGIALGKKRSANAELLELPYLRVANVQRGWLDLSEIKTTLVTSREAEALRLEIGDILMNEGGDRDKLGRGWVWDGEIEDCIHQNHVFRLRLRTRKVSSRYVSLYANEVGNRYFLEQGKQTTNLASISKSKVSNMPIPVAPPDELKQIVKRVESALLWLDKIATEHSLAAHLLPKLDQAILAKAFRGELAPRTRTMSPPPFCSSGSEMSARRSRRSPVVVERRAHE